MVSDDLIQEAIRFSKTCPNCGIVDGLVRRETEGKFEFLCPKCGAVRFCFYKAGDEYVTLNRETADCSAEWENCFTERPASD